MVGSVENGCNNFPTLIEGLTLKKRTSPLKWAAFPKGTRVGTQYPVSSCIDMFITVCMCICMCVCKGIADLMGRARACVYVCSCAYFSFRFAYKGLCSFGYQKVSMYGCVLVAVHTVSEELLKDSYLSRPPPPAIEALTTFYSAMFKQAPPNDYAVLVHGSYCSFR